MSEILDRIKQFSYPYRCFGFSIRIWEAEGGDIGMQIYEISNGLLSLIYDYKHKNYQVCIDTYGKGSDSYFRSQVFDGIETFEEASTCFSALLGEFYENS